MNFTKSQLADRLVKWAKHYVKMAKDDEYVRAGGELERDRFEAMVAAEVTKVRMEYEPDYGMGFGPFSKDQMYYDRLHQAEQRVKEKRATLENNTEMLDFISELVTKFFEEKPAEVAKNVISDSDKLSLLENKHNLLKKWLKDQIKNTKDAKLPEPHPLDFSLSSPSEEMEERAYVEHTNGRLDAKVMAYEHVLNNILNEDKVLERELDDLDKKRNPRNEYDI